MPLQLLPMPESEYPIYISVMISSFEDLMGKLWFPNGLSDADIQHLVDDMKRYAQRHPGRTEVLKVIDTDLPDSDPLNKVVGISQWRTFPRERTEEEIRQEDADEEADHAEHGFPPNAHTEAVANFYTVAAEYQKKHLGRDGYVFLALLATRPGQGRRGIGAFSMKHGAEKADMLGVPMYLEASPDGVGLYKKWGYEVVDELPYDTKRFGCEGQQYTTLCMKRPARKYGVLQARWALSCRRRAEIRASS